MRRVNWSRESYGTRKDKFFFCFYKYLVYDENTFTYVQTLLFVLCIRRYWFRETSKHRVGSPEGSGKRFNTTWRKRDFFPAARKCVREKTRKTWLTAVVFGRHADGDRARATWNTTFEIITLSSSSDIACRNLWSFSDGRQMTCYDQHARFSDLKLNASGRLFRANRCAYGFWRESFARCRWWLTKKRRTRKRKRKYTRTTAVWCAWYSKVSKNIRAPLTRLGVRV